MKKLVIIFIAFNVLCTLLQHSGVDANKEYDGALDGSPVYHSRRGNYYGGKVPSRLHRKRLGPLVFVLIDVATFAFVVGAFLLPIIGVGVGIGYGLAAIFNAIYD